MSSKPRLNSLFRIQTIFILSEGGVSGYGLAKKLEEQTGKKPSSGKIYPFLHQLEENQYIEEIDIETDSDRSKKVYQMTDKGQKLVSELLDKMSNILDARLEDMLDVCEACNVQLYDKGDDTGDHGHLVIGISKEGDPAKFCCTHCRDYYYHEYDIKPE